MTSELPTTLQIKIKHIRHNCQIIREDEIKEHAGENPHSAIACYKKSGGIEFISTMIGYGNSNNGGRSNKVLQCGEVFSWSEEWMVND